MKKDLKIVEEKMLELAKMIFDFSKVNRATFHYDKKTLESDTDHTVMLSILSSSFAKEFYPELDLGLISQFATVHDLVEVYAGDTITVKISKKSLKNKELREREAFLKIKNNFKEIFPWIHETIEEYESQKTKEARFVKLLDKLIPEITNVLNENQYFKSYNKDKDFIKEHLDDKLEKYKEKLLEFPELLILFKDFKEKMLSI